MTSTSRRNILQYTVLAAIGVAMKNSLVPAADTNDDPIKKAFSRKLEVTDLGDGLHLIANGGGNTVVQSGRGRSSRNRQRAWCFGPGIISPRLTSWRRMRNGRYYSIPTGIWTIPEGMPIYGRRLCHCRSENCRRRYGRRITMEDMGFTIDPSLRITEHASPQHARCFRSNPRICLQGSPAPHSLDCAGSTPSMAIACSLPQSDSCTTVDLLFNGIYTP